MRSIIRESIVGYIRTSRNTLFGEVVCKEASWAFLGADVVSEISE